MVASRYVSGDQVTRDAPETLATRLLDPPVHTPAGVGTIDVIVGDDTRLTVAVAVDVQPAPVVAVTVYTVVDAGSASTELPVVWLKPPDGLQV